VALSTLSPSISLTSTMQACINNSQLDLISSVLFLVSTGISKISILLFYRRIFPSRILHRIVWGLVLFTSLYTAACMLVNVFACMPITKSWELKHAKSGTCINKPAFYSAQASMGVFTDFATVILPLPNLWRLNMATKQKVGTAAMITVGGLYAILTFKFLW
jgi:hypothetical protein